MSASANWSYTARATYWPLQSRDDWSGAKVYGAPVGFDCDYSAEAKNMIDAKGVEFTTRQIVFTEFDAVQPGDMLMIGESVEADPVAAGAFEVRAITRDADTFDRVADDLKVMT